MKKLALLILFSLLVCGLAIAQEQTTGSLAYAPTVDVMGAHENGGRGCAGCHAPHSGGRGSGGNIISKAGSYTPAGTEEGDTGLWGTDTNPIETGLPTITFDSKYTTTISGLTWSSGKLYTGVVTCLSCHDGNVSKGAMMSGVSYEQAWGLLNFATTAGSNGTQNAVTLYGPNPIPTLLGNDGGVAGDYNNDHPVGPLANLGAVFGNAVYIASQMTINFSTRGSIANIVPVTGTPFANFVSGYGTPAISSMAVPSGDTAVTDVYIVCTTCHDQHVMNVYSTATYGTVPIAGGAGVTEATIFFVNGPYNPAAPYSPKYEPSTMRFCQQCHFSMSSEANGTGTAVGTAF